MKAAESFLELARLIVDNGLDHLPEEYWNRQDCVCIVIKHDGKVLVVTQSGTNQKGLPKGGLEPDTRIENVKEKTKLNHLKDELYDLRTMINAIDSCGTDNRDMLVRRLMSRFVYLTYVKELYEELNLLPCMLKRVSTTPPIRMKDGRYMHVVFAQLAHRRYESQISCRNSMGEISKVDWMPIDELRRHKNRVEYNASIGTVLRHFPNV